MVASALRIVRGPPEARRGRSRALAEAAWSRPAALLVVRVTLGASDEWALAAAWRASREEVVVMERSMGGGFERRREGREKRFMPWALSVHCAKKSH